MSYDGDHLNGYSLSDAGGPFEVERRHRNAIEEAGGVLEEELRRHGQHGMAVVMWDRHGNVYVRCRHLPKQIQVKAA